MNNLENITLLNTELKSYPNKIVFLDENTEKQCDRALRLFGESQLLVTIEEMAEFTQVLLKYVNRNRREPEDMLKVIDECSDVCITLYQAIKQLGIKEEVLKHIPEKGERLGKKLDKYENKIKNVNNKEE